MSSTVDQLKEQIEQAFADVPYPGDEICADKCSREECMICAVINEHFRGRHWSEVRRSALESHCYDLSSFTPAALHHYLPTYLLAALEGVGDTLESVIFNLKPRAMGTRDQFFEVLATFTPAQKNAIKAFLEYSYAGGEGARPHSRRKAAEALEYWNKDWTRVLDEAPPINSRADRLRQQIEQAFAGTPYPGDDGIGYDKEDWECAEVNEHFQGRRWKEVPRYALLYHQHDLPFFSPAGLQYYLPTYLFAALDDFCDTLDDTVYHLKPDEGELRDYFLARMAVFTPAQRNAIKTFLEYVRDETADSLQKENIAKALEYWGRDQT